MKNVWKSLPQNTFSQSKWKSFKISWQNTEFYLKKRKDKNIPLYMYRENLLSNSSLHLVPTVSLSVTFEPLKYSPKGFPWSSLHRCTLAHPWYNVIITFTQIMLSITFIQCCPGQSFNNLWGWGGEALICSICNFLWCKFSKYHPLQATLMTSLNTNLERYTP